MIETRDDLARWITESLKDAHKSTSRWRMEARKCYDFYASNQWEEEAKAQMIEQRKVPVVFNRVARTINAVIGLEIQNRQQVQYIPREVGDTQVNEIYTSAADWIRDNCDAEDEESEAFQDLMICGVGGTETRIDYDEEPDGKPVIERIDPLELFWDPTARKKNLRDRRWTARVKRVSDADIREMFPGYTAPEKTGESYLEERDQPHDATRPLYDGDEPSATQPRHRELVCFEWWEKKPFFRFVDLDGQMKTVDEQQAQTIRERFTQLVQVTPGMQMPQMVEQKKKVYYKAYLVGNEVLEAYDLEVQSGFTINFITGARDRNNNTWFGLVSLMMDPQRWANKWLSQIMHILNSSAKGGLIAEKDAFSKTSDAEQSWAKSETITWANPGAVSGGKIQPKPNTPMPDGFAKLLDFAVNSINDVPGVNMELMGLVGANQPGVLENMRKQAGMTILAVFFDAIRLYRKEQGRIMIEIIRDKISDGRLIRVVGKQGAQYVPLIRDPQAKEFDVVVDEAPTSSNNKERVFALMTQLAPVFQNAGMPIPPDILDYSPLPARLAETWKEFARQSKQLSPEVQAKLSEMDQALQVMQAQSKALADENLKLRTDMAVDVYKVNKQAEVDTQLAAMKAETESEKRQVELYKANLDAMMEKLSLAMDTMAQNMRVAGESHIPRTEQAVGRLGEALAPALQQMMELSVGQAQQLQNLGPMLEQLGERIVQGVRQSFADNRLVSSSPVYGENGRMRAIRRRFGDGTEDELPYGQTMMQ
jgi:hypothetical protein